MPHIALLGDSIFDNRKYIAGQPDVCRLLNDLLPQEWNATLLAVDGATCADVPSQLARLPAETTHLVVSMGGNDALLAEHLFHRRVHSASEALLMLSGTLDEFELAYRAAMRQIQQTGLPVTACTIYNANIEGIVQAKVFKCAIALFNDVIIRVAREEGPPLVELRSVCTEPADYANDIEPSMQGGRKIAAAILSTLFRTQSCGMGCNR